MDPRYSNNPNFSGVSPDYATGGPKKDAPLTKDQQNYVGHINDPVPGDRTGMTPRVDPDAIGTGQSSGFTKPAFGSLDEYQKYLKGDEATQKGIADKYEQELKANTDFINATYDKLVGDRKTINANDEGRSRALIAGGQFGGSGGAGAVTKTNDTADKGTQALAQIEAQRVAKLQDARSLIFNKKAAEQDKGYQQRQSEYSNFEAITSRQNKQALDSIKSFAAGGGDLDKLKTQEPDWYKKYIDAFGGSELALDAYLESNKPADQKIKYTEKVYKGENGNAFVYRYGFDPKTGTLKSFDQDTGNDYTSFAGKVGTKNVEFKTGGDGQLYAVSTTPDEFGNFKSVKIGGPKTTKPVVPKNTAPKKSGNLTYTGDDITEGSQKLDQSRGPDGYANSQLYFKAYRAWVDGGGAIQDFQKLFPPAKYVNPRDSSVPVYLRPKATGGA